MHNQPLEIFVKRSPENKSIVSKALRTSNIDVACHLILPLTRQYRPAWNKRTALGCKQKGKREREKEAKTFALPPRWGKLNNCSQCALTSLAPTHRPPTIRHVGCVPCNDTQRNSSTPLDWIFLGRPVPETSTRPWHIEAVYAYRTCASKIRLSAQSTSAFSKLARSLTFCLTWLSWPNSFPVNYSVK